MRLVTANPKGKAKNARNSQDKSTVIREINEAVADVIEAYKANNPNVDVDAILAEYDGLLLNMVKLRKRELDTFVAYAKEQGTKMPFEAMETGVLDAGRKDMRNSLTEILDSVGFERPVCPECEEEMMDRGRSKKNS